MIETGIYIRAKIDGNWESVDIGDKRLGNEDLRAWLQTLKPEGLVRTVMRVLERE